MKAKKKVADAKKRAADAKKKAAGAKKTGSTVRTQVRETVKKAVSSGGVNKGELKSSIKKMAGKDARVKNPKIEEAIARRKNERGAGIPLGAQIARGVVVKSSSPKRDAAMKRASQRRTGKSY